MSKDLEIMEFIKSEIDRFDELAFNEKDFDTFKELQDKMETLTKLYDDINIKFYNNSL